MAAKCFFGKSKLQRRQNIEKLLTMTTIAISWKKPTIALSIIFRLIRKMLERRIKNEIPNKTHIMQSCIHLHSNSRMRTMGI